MKDSEKCHYFSFRLFNLKSKGSETGSKVFSNRQAYSRIKRVIFPTKKVLYRKY